MGKNVFNNKYLKSVKKRKYIAFIIIIIAVILFLVFFYFMDNNDLPNKEQYNKKQVQEEVVLKNNAPNHEIDIPDRFLELEKAIAKNKDTVGWINIPNTTIDYPIMQAKDNDYYLRRNEDAKYSFEGCIFGDYESVFNPLDNLSNNLVCHGHNLDDNPDGKRFAQLVKFQHIDFAKNNPYIFITIRDASLVYQIYAVYFTDIYFGYTMVGLDKNMQQAMIDSAKKRSEYIYKDVDVSGEDDILTLSTCTYKFGVYESLGQKNTRFSIQAVRLNENSTLLKQANIEKNPDIRAPRIQGDGRLAR